MWSLHLRSHRGQANLQKYYHTISFCVHYDINLMCPMGAQISDPKFLLSETQMLLLSERGCQLTWFSQKQLHMLIELNHPCSYAGS